MLNITKQFLKISKNPQNISYLCFLKMSRGRQFEDSGALMLPGCATSKQYMNTKEKLFHLGQPLFT